MKHSQKKMPNIWSHLSFQTDLFIGPYLKEEEVEAAYYDCNIQANLYPILTI